MNVNLITSYARTLSCLFCKIQRQSLFGLLRENHRNNLLTPFNFYRDVRWKCFTTNSMKMKDKQGNPTETCAVTEDPEKVKIFFKTQDGEVFECLAHVNENVMDAAVKNDIAMFGSCEGKLCCCVCHVYIDETYSKFIPDIKEDELDMLEVAPLQQSNSRLSCQIIVTKELEGAVFTLPKSEDDQLGFDIQ